MKYQTVITGALDGQKVDIVVKIRLNDERKNGHQDFAITGDIYEHGKLRTDRNCLGGGAIGHKIAKIEPEFQIFEDLHLRDYLGNPMHATANLAYFLSVEKMPKDKFCAEYDATPEEYDALLDYTENSTLFYIGLTEKTDMLRRWKSKADKAIEILEQLTGSKFVNTSTRTQLVIPSEDQIKAEKDKLASGYYSKDEKVKRANEKRRAEQRAKIDKIEAEFSKKQKSLDTEKAICLFFAKYDYTFSNFIYHAHSNELAFNWKNYEKQLSASEIEKVTKKLQKLIEKYGFSISVKSK